MLMYKYVNRVHSQTARKSLNDLILFGITKQHNKNMRYEPSAFKPASTTTKLKNVLKFKMIQNISCKKD